MFHILLHLSSSWSRVSLNINFHAISLSHDPCELGIQHVGKSGAFKAHHDRLLTKVGIKTETKEGLYV